MLVYLYSLTYSGSVGSRVEALLRYYAGKGVLTVLAMPPHLSSMSYYFGQLTALYDCFYRSRYTSNYIVMQDWDEYILPLKHNNWNEMLTVLERNASEYNSDLGQKTGSFGFLCSYYMHMRLKSSEWDQFKREFPISEDDFDFILDYKAEIFIEQHRFDFHEYPVRIKSIFRPEAVVEPGIHFPYVMRKNARMEEVNSTVGFLAHHNPHPHGYKLKPVFHLHASVWYREYLDRLIQADKDFQAFIILPKPDSDLQAFKDVQKELPVIKSRKVIRRPKAR